MDGETNDLERPKIQVRESYYVVNADDEIDLDEIPVYLVTNHEEFRIPVKVVRRVNNYLGNRWIVRPANGSGEFEVDESKLEIDVMDYYA